MASAVVSPEWLTVCAQIVQVNLGGLFLVAGMAKLAAPRRFITAVREYRLLPAGVVPGAAVVVMAGEVAAGIALLTGRAAVAAVLGAGLLVTVFAGATTVVIARGLVVECGCFGAASRRVGRDSVYRLIVIGTGLALLAGCWWGLGLTPLRPESAGVARLVTVVSLAAAATMLVAWGLAATTALRTLTNHNRSANPGV